MKKQVYIQVPEPCHEDWSKMTQMEQGRFCRSCAKEVVDFSVMSDQEIIDFLSKPRGKTCGNFSNDQLNRAIKEPTPPAKKRGWAIVLSFLITLAGACKLRSDATRGKIEATAGVMMVEGCRAPEHLNNTEDTTAAISQPPEIVIEEPMLKGEIATVGVMDVAEVYCEKPIIADQILEVADTAREDTTYLPHVIVTGYGRTKRRQVAGGISIIEAKQLSIIPKVVDTLSRLVRSNELRLYPNPATKAGFVNVIPGEAASYELMLMNSQGQSISRYKFSISSKDQVYKLELPASIAAGMYYIAIINEQTRKQVTQKLIVQ
jgi:hypothetical protein